MCSVTVGRRHVLQNTDVKLLLMVHTAAHSKLGPSLRKQSILLTAPYSRSHTCSWQMHVSSPAHIQICKGLVSIRTHKQSQLGVLCRSNPGTYFSLLSHFVSLGRFERHLIIEMQLMQYSVGKERTHTHTHMYASAETVGRHRGANSRLSAGINQWFKSIWD